MLGVIVAVWVIHGSVDFTMMLYYENKSAIVIWLIDDNSSSGMGCGCSIYHIAKDHFRSHCQTPQWSDGLGIHNSCYPSKK